MAMTKPTKPLFVYWAGKAKGETTNGNDMYIVSYYRERGFNKPQNIRGFSSELIEHLDDKSWDNLGEKAPITLTVERGSPNASSADGFYWNLLAIELGHDSELWPDGAPEEAEEAEVPAPRTVTQAPADDRDEVADYINKESSGTTSNDNGQNNGQAQPNVPIPAAIGACANHAADFIVAGLMPKPEGVDILDWHRDCRDVIYSMVNQAPPANLRWCSTHGNVYRQDSKQRWYHKHDGAFCVEGQGVLDTDGKAVI